MTWHHLRSLISSEAIKWKAKNSTLCEQFRNTTDNRRNKNKIDPLNIYSWLFTSTKKVEGLSWFYMSTMTQCKQTNICCIIIRVHWQLSQLTYQPPNMTRVVIIRSSLKGISHIKSFSEINEPIGRIRLWNIPHLYP